MFVSTLRRPAKPVIHVVVSASGLAVWGVRPGMLSTCSDDVQPTSPR